MSFWNMSYHCFLHNLLYFLLFACGKIDSHCVPEITKFPRWWHPTNWKTVRLLCPCGGLAVLKEVILLPDAHVFLYGADYFSFFSSLKVKVTGKQWWDLAIYLFQHDWLSAVALVAEGQMFHEWSIKTGVRLSKAFEKACFWAFFFYLLWSAGHCQTGRGRHNFNKWHVFSALPSMEQCSTYIVSVYFVKFGQRLKKGLYLGSTLNSLCSNKYL